jgi:peptide chain release factor 1
MSISLERIVSIEARKHELSDAMAKGNLAPDDFVRLSKEYSQIEPVAAAAREVRRLRAERESLTVMTKDADEDLRSMALEELAEIEAALPLAERALAIHLLPKDSADERAAMLEVRAGTGGDEAALFAGDLMRMYQRFAEERGWKFELINASASGGRIHTSAATVAVLPEAEDVDVQINDADLRIDVYRSSGPGGQSVNTTDSAVRITHLPTGLVVIQQDEKSQHKNKAKALKVLRTRLYELERSRLADERAGTRKSMVGSGDRSERIRTYNFPQGRVTDHRINLTLHKLDAILAGPGLEELTDALIAEDEAERLAGLDEA